MLKIYYRSSCSSSRKALAWFKVYKVPINIQPLETLTNEELRHVLSLTEKGVMEVLKHPNRMKGELRQEMKHLLNHNFNTAVDYMTSHPEILRSPIIFTGKKYMIGYNTEEIRKFIPRKYRQELRFL